MSLKLDHLERTILDLGTEIYRVKHRMDLVERENSYYQEIFTNLRKILDEKGVVNLDEFDENIHLERILNRQHAAGMDGAGLNYETDLKKAIN